MARGELPGGRRSPIRRPASSASGGAAGREGEEEESDRHQAAGEERSRRGERKWMTGAFDEVSSRSE
ncbi:hypothetical protein NL676_031064 [Syzygium grande]|nr:hypothetical protein NL676_031064 [Syzygium grande]